jgi:hypothetical protein
MSGNATNQALSADSRRRGLVLPTLPIKVFDPFGRGTPRPSRPRQAARQFHTARVLLPLRGSFLFDFLGPVQDDGQGSRARFVYFHVDEKPLAVAGDVVGKRVHDTH